MDIVGTSGPDTLEGTSGNDRLFGLEGNDLLEAFAGDDQLDGGAGDDILKGGAGKNVLDGGAGLDTADYSDWGQDIRVNLGGSTPATVGGITAQDTIRNVENVTGGSAYDELTGDSHDNVLKGGGGGDFLTGGDGNDVLLGGDGTDWLDGSGGVDYMDGGNGLDFYRVRDPHDVVNDTGADDASDTVYFLGTVGTYTMGAGIETAFLNASAGNGSLIGNDSPNTLLANAFDNVLDGRGGADFMDGETGNDTYYVDNVGDEIDEFYPDWGTDLVITSVDYTLPASVENIDAADGTSAVSLTGNDLANDIRGNGGSNVLDGKTGADVMAGGAGNDTYVVDNAGDVVSESAGQGTDTVRSSITYTLSTDVENLTLAGTGTIHGNGNTLANILIGNSGNNILNGKGGADIMRGGAGNDTYYVSNRDDVAQEAANQGIDRVKSSVGYSLAGQYIEALTLIGSANINAAGNSLANTLIGNSGDNILNGNAGADVITGGGGADTFAFLSSFVGTSNVDTVADFESGTDTIQLKQTYFAGLALGQLAAAQFATGAATGSGPQIVYDQSTGALFYDGNGAGAGGATQFATLTGAPAVTNADFKVVV